MNNTNCEHMHSYNKGKGGKVHNRLYWQTIVLEEKWGRGGQEGVWIDRVVDNTCD